YRGSSQRFPSRHTTVANRAREPYSLANDVERPTLDLAVNAPNVLADDAEKDQLHAADERHADEQQRPTRNPDARPQPQDQRVDDAEHRQSGSAEPHPDRQSEWSQRKRQDAVGREADHLGEGIFGRSGKSRGALVLNGLLAKSQPGHHSAHKTVALRHVEQ